MKTIKLSSHRPSVAALLNIARHEVVLLTTENGESFIVSHADDFDTEVELLRQNHSFLTMLDKFKKEEDTIPLEEAEQQLR